MTLKIDARTDARAVPFGPARDWLPDRFTAHYTYDDMPLQLKLHVTFNGVDRPRVARLRAERTDGDSLTPEDIVSLRLASVMAEVVPTAMTRMKGAPHNDLFVLARLYWASWVSWNNPRQAIMTHFDMPRSTANYRIRKAREQYHLPSAWHAP